MVTRKPLIGSRKRATARAVVLRCLVSLGGLCLLLTPNALLGQRPNLQKATIEAFADRSAYQPGDQIRVAARASIEPGWHLQSHTPSFDYLIPTELSVTRPEGWSSTLTVEYPEHEMWQSSFEAEPLAVYEGQPVFVASFLADASAKGGELELEVTLAYQACDDRVCLPPTTANTLVQLSIGPGGKEQHSDLFDGGAAPGRGAPKTNLFGMLVLGILGGLILNAMPCVLPILSLKVFALVKTAGLGRRAVSIGALATSLGILVSFWALAAAAIGVRAAGGLVGWGIQFQNPVFVAFLNVVLVFFCLNLWGLFEIPLPRRLAGGLGGSASSNGLAGHFSSGLFATLMATPCSAPFLGTAVGFGLSQNTSTIALMFTAIGFGMALPYLLLALAPGVSRVLPKPGPWMDHLRGAMGFLLAGTAVWLLYVLSAQITAPKLALVEIALLLIGFFAWLKHRFQLTGPTAIGSRIATVGMLAAALLTLGIAQTSDPAQAAQRGVSRLPWVEFDQRRAEEIAASGGLVFVDVTADWCATCKVNERLVLETDLVVDLFSRHDVVTMKADWTNRNDQITRYLEGFGRYAIPFYVLYRPGSEPHVFGELLTKRSVLRVVEESAPSATAAF